MYHMFVGYSNLKQIKETTNTRIYQGIRDIDNLAVIIKLIKAQYSTLENFHRYRQEYEIINCLEHPAIIKVYELIRYQNSLGIVMEDASAKSLSQLSVETKLTLEEVIELSLKIIDALDIVHQANIIHKDINPSNILFNRQTKTLKLIDFGIATQLPREQLSIHNYKILEGTLAYVSPEQTGRMNRALDYRTDYYSLGVTLYQLLTQQLPFEHQEPRALIHDHMVKTPLFPQQLKPEIPQVVSDIVMKLMSKNAEDRYQSASGLKYDLETCLEQLNNHGEIKEFKLGQQDKCDRFIIPDRLYGRESEVKILLNSFERVAQGKSEMILVAGFSGIGKTAIVNEVHKPITRQKGYFIKGKFDQFTRNIPFSAFVVAFNDLVKQLLAESDDQLSQWKQDLLATFESNGQVVIDVIPDLEIILGQQPEVPELSGSAAQNRFNLLFSKFVQVFTKQEHPLVIFLDDLQWADSASLGLLKLLLSESDTNGNSLLVIGAYRDNEVFPAHPLMLCLQEIKQEKAVLSTITLEPLTEPDLNLLVSDTLLCLETITQPLSALIYQKTDGNPFFTTQFLKSLYEDGYIDFNQEANYWQCDLTKLKQVTLTDNVVEFMVARLQKLPEAAQNILKLAACIGNHFDLKTLEIICEKSEVEITHDLWSVLQTGLIIPQTDIYRLFAEDEGQNISQDSAIKYRFLHDRVQQAAYALISEKNKSLTHWHIGQLLIAKLTQEQQEQQLFELVNQLNLGKKEITNLKQRQNLAELNLQAGKKAKLAAAFQAAYRLFNNGIELLNDTSWVNNYNLIYQLHFNASETAYLSGNFEQAEALYKVSLSNSQSILDQAGIYRLQMTQYQLQGRNQEAIFIQRQSLQLLGWSVPETSEEIEKNLEKQISVVNKFLVKQTIEKILKFSFMEDNQIIEMLRILQILFYAAWLDGKSNLALLALAKMTTLSLHHGNSEMSPFGYVGYGILLNTLEKDASQAYKFGKMAVQLCEQFDNADVRAMTNFLFAADVHSWYRPLKEADIYYENAYKYGMDAGNWLTVSFMMMLSGSDRLTAGKNLNELQKLVKTHVDFLYQVKSLDNRDALIAGVLQPIRNLLGLTEGIDSFDDQYFQEAKYLEKYHDTSYHLAWLYSVKIRHAYLFNQQETYLDLIPKLSVIEKTVPSHAKVPSTVFYTALMYLKLIEQDNSAELTDHYWQSLAILETKLTCWLENCPANILHKQLLIQAEKARLQGQTFEALEHYDNAIAQAKVQNYIYEEALANELAARFYLDWGKEKVAAGYMQEAYYCYVEWGAKAKTNHLEENYFELLGPILQQTNQAFNPLQTLSTLSNLPNSNTLVTQTSFNLNHTFDLTDILRSSKVLTKTLELDDLLKQLSQIILQNSGGDHLIIALMDNTGAWLINVIADTENLEFVTESLEGNSHNPIKLINYVKNTQEIVLVNNLETELPIIDDYLLEQKPQSILALPLKYQDKIVGVLYLHSTSAKNIFSSERLVILEFLCSQAAISIENAGLYDQLKNYSQSLEQRVKERTEELRVAKELALSASQAKSDFLSSMSHELRTPLNGILGYAQILRRNRSLTEKQVNGLNIIHQSGNHLLTLINDILDLSKIEARKLELYPTGLNFSVFLDSVVGMIKMQALAKDILFTWEAEENLPLGIKADEKRLRQVLVNLLGNAVKFTEQGKVTLKVSSIGQIENQTQTLRFEVIDTGVGMTPEQLTHIFQPFEQVGDKQKQAMGTGLGLAISKQLVELMGGEIKVTSQLGQGSNFWFEISLLITEVAPTIQTNAIDRIINYQGDRLQLLVVDDKEINRLLLENMLEPLGFEIAMVENGQQAIKLTQVIQPDLIIMNLEMPVKKGFEAAQEIRQIPSVKDTPIIAVSASVLDKDFLTVGFNAFLPKPIDESKLLSLIQEHLDVTWIYDQKDKLSTQLEISTATSDLQSLIAPPVEELEILYELAMFGNMKKIKERAVYLAELDPKYAAFAAKLRDSASGFQEKAIFNLIEQYLEANNLDNTDNKYKLAAINIKSDSEFVLNRDALTIMSDDWLIQLEKAAIALDENKLLDLLKQISDEHVYIAKALEEQVKNCAFDQIIDLIR